MARGELLELLIRQSFWVLGDKRKTIRGKLPESTSWAARKSSSLETVVSPASAILEDGLDATGQQFLPICFRQAQGVRRCLVDITSRSSSWVSRQVSEDRLDEHIESGDRHVAFCLTSQSAVMRYLRGSACRRRTVLLGHRDVRTTMVYTRIIDRGPLGVISRRSRRPPSPHGAP
ncbi:uncharacterized protein SOCE26_002760 [Sorangium cellulosum]|uniref:Tyr recombinase domain-containing protein n=1 Tax=Sorangium cellulosum TaxID=56 RepID=A0A2L0EHY2_SORCE|nr:uncharacterized protein SOCE26_002760 [Sorangium cellulosum]